ncbi:MAG: O-antigen ligase family protein [Polyangiaceae bacterium]|nr:O-antigen ligase family protein [Polyangiaceae bacterium]
MFILPGLVLLLLFLLGRPFDFIPALQGVPLLYLFCALSLLGYVVDARLRFTEVRPAQHLGLAIAFLAWCCLSVAMVDPGAVTGSATQVAVLFLIYGLLAQGIQTFKSFEVVAGVILACVLFVCVVCIHLGAQPSQCVAFLPGETRLIDSGHPDGRACTLDLECFGAIPQAQYSCESAGLFGLTTVGDGRIRYTGTLQDPNEVALLVGSGLPLAFAFFQRKPTHARLVLAVLSAILTVVTVVMSGSRGGRLVLLTVFGMYSIRKWGLRTVLKATLPLLVIAVPALIALSGPAREDADASTEERLGCWQTGVRLMLDSPLFGIGHNKFVDHHELTAHNAYLLAAGELGVPGVMMFSGLIYVAIKTLILIGRRSRGPEASVALIWANALLSSMSGLAIGIFFLSFTYHHVLWVFLGLTGAVYAAMRTHDRAFRVPLGWRDLVVLASLNAATLSAVYAYTRHKIGIL